MKAALSIFTTLLALLLSLPIWFYLQYKILSMVGATDLMWFLFWVYVPATFLVTALGNVIKALAAD